MAISTSLRRNASPSRLTALLTSQRFNFNHTLAEDQAQAQSQFYADRGSDSIFGAGGTELSKWRKLDSRVLGIKGSMISESSWAVLKILQSRGFKAYLVGGCVRDLILNKVPKDFDVITTADLNQIKKEFRRCQIVGRRFPICRVLLKGTVVEVSSFETVAQHDLEKENFHFSYTPSGIGKNDLLRWKNSMHRDFTVNSLFFDPSVSKIYDYANGIRDLRSLKLQTLKPAHLSFEEDSARILRGLRIAARLGLQISKEVEVAIHELSSSILSLNKSRIMMEVDYMLSYGAAEPSLCLLRKFNLLQILLPFHAACIEEQASQQSSLSSTMLMKLFFYLDRLVTCDRPSDCSLWVGLLAFHLALVNNPQPAIVVWTLASVLYHGNWKAGVAYARKHVNEQYNFVPEILETHNFISDDELAGKVRQLAMLVQESMDILTEKDVLLQKIARFEGSPCGLVFVSKNMGNFVAQLFTVLVDNVESYDVRRKSITIDYKSLKKGFLNEIRFALGKIIMDAMSFGTVKNNEIIREKNQETLQNTVKESIKKQSTVIDKNLEVMEEKKKKQNRMKNKKTGKKIYEHKKAFDIENSSISPNQTDQKIVELKLTKSEDVKRWNIVDECNQQKVRITQPKATVEIENFRGHTNKTILERDRKRKHTARENSIQNQNPPTLTQSQRPPTLSSLFR